MIKITLIQLLYFKDFFNYRQPHEIFI